MVHATISCIFNQAKKRRKKKKKPLKRKSWYQQRFFGGEEKGYLLPKKEIPCIINDFVSC